MIDTNKLVEEVESLLFNIEEEELYSFIAKYNYSPYSNLNTFHLAKYNLNVTLDQIKSVLHDNAMSAGMIE